jgi:hypothetical protein
MNPTQMPLPMALERALDLTSVSRIGAADAEKRNL